MTIPATVRDLIDGIKPGDTLVVLDREEADGQGRHEFTAYWKDADRLRGQCFRADLQGFLARHEKATVVTQEALKAAYEARRGVAA